MPNIPFTITAPADLRPDFRELDVDTSPGSAHAMDLVLPLKVSQLVSMLKADVEQKHRSVRVVGELSSFKQWRSGHCYFDIKDEETILPAVMFKPHFARLPFVPKDGQEIIFSGRISIYTANSKLQMCVEAMEPLGQGALALAFEQLKERLKAEGLFDPNHKKPIARFNQCVGLITSSHGAVLRDMVRILKSRMPGVDILFSPVRVQGAGASLEIKAAIELLDQMGACDVIIVGRGGGSLEDLWPFNEEVVARAIFNAKTPIISAVGHETDFSISDFVADIRAATPTHAATLVVPELSDLIAELESAKSHLLLRLRGHIRESCLTVAQHKKQLKDPRILLFKHWQGLDERSKRLQDLLSASLKHNRQQIIKLNTRLSLVAPLRMLRHKKDALFAAKSSLARLNPAQKIMLHARDLGAYQKSLDDRMFGVFANKKNALGEAVVKLEALSPLKVLVRGYSLVQAEDGRILSKKADFSPGQSLLIRVEDGEIRAKVS